jgi:hypothetical protein
LLAATLKNKIPAAASILSQLPGKPFQVAVL